MEWNDEALILSVRQHGETAAVVEVLAAQHGRYLGLVHGGRSRRLRPVLQTGNHVDAAWRARLADQLGSFSIELRRGYAAEAMASPDPMILAGLASIAAMARQLPEREPHPALYEVTMFVLSFLDDSSVWPALYARWELALLAELGFGLDLSSCAATGETENLVYVSPKSGRAVSQAAGEPYRDRMLPLPAFLRGGGSASVTTEGDVADALRVTAHFLETRVLGPNGDTLPDVRLRLARMIDRNGAGA